MANYIDRFWMDRKRIDEATSELTKEYAAGLRNFMEFAAYRPLTLETCKMFCPCNKCQNMKCISVKNVWSHLYRKGFFPSYKIWYFHGEDGININYGSYNIAGSSSLVGEIGNFGNEIPPDELGSSTFVERDVAIPIHGATEGGTSQMVNDAFREEVNEFTAASEQGEVPNIDAQNFFGLLDAANQPLYSGCGENVSLLSSAAEMMNIKTDYNLPESCVDALTGHFKKYLPADNMYATSYNDIQKMVAALRLPYETIDMCVDNCMIYWRQDYDLLQCRFCWKPRYQENSGRTRVPYKKMWYLPLGDRLKRLYQSERTAGTMRWHCEHNSGSNITHPSDAKAWKHFQSTYPNFAAESRNVYLGLSTDGFNPFGKHGRPYSVWPVIVTPYNLPPTLCMKQKYLFLTVLVPGPDHPRRSLDVFLQPLIHELKQLWETRTPVYDVSRSQNFTMRVVLLWTISDFLAYGMLLGWSTHGKLACPYCQDNTDAFQLRHG